MRRLLTTILLGLSCLAAVAADSSPQMTDFARMMSVRLAGSGPLHELALPAEVYGGVTRPDLADLALFNGAGEVVPFTLVRPAPENTVMERRSLPLYPLAAAGGRQPGNLALRVHTDEHGADLTLDSTPGGMAPAGVSGYVVDARGLQAPVSGFDLELNGDGRTFLGTVRVETSDDLRQWREHAIGALATLFAGKRELHRSTVQFPTIASPYYRLTVCPEAGAPRISGATARLAAPVNAKREQWRYPLTPVKGEAGAYLVRTGGNMPVDRMRLAFTTDNSLAGVTLFSRPDDRSSWIERGHGVCYRLRRDATLLESAPLEIPPTTDRQWLIRLRQPGSGFGGALPVLEVGWQPARLIFAARGEPPFSLAYGSARTGDESLQDDSMAGILDTWEHQQVRPLPATVGASQETGGRAALRPRLPAKTWKKLLLWCSLFGGVLILARMAWQLARELEMGNKSNHPPDNGVSASDGGNM